MARREAFPCHDCAARFVGCHAVCEAYKATKAELDARRAAERPKREAVAQIIDMHKKDVARARRDWRVGK